MIQTQTFDLPNNEEREVLAKAISLLGEKRYAEAAEVMIKRHDQLTAAPKLKLYDQRAA